MQITMTLYDLTKKYSSGKGEDMMWKTLSIVSDAVDASMSSEDRTSLVRKVYGAMSGEHYNEEFAHEDIAKMYYKDDDGEKHFAPYWSTETLHSLYRQHKDEIPDGYNCWDWAVTMNMIKSDNRNLLMDWFPDMDDDERDEKYIQLSLNWLRDEDNPFGPSKTWGYLNSK